MANPDHVSRLQGGVECWNRWRAVCTEVPDLSGAVFKKQNFTGIDFSHVDLRGAAFSECTLNDANFESAQLQGASFSGITCARSVNFTWAQMCPATITRCTWLGANLQDATAVGTQFEESAFLACKFQRCHLERTQWRNCTLKKSNLEDANLSGSRFEPVALWPPQPANRMSDCVWTNANLSSTDLRGITGYQFDHNNIQGAMTAPRASDDWSVLRRTYTGSRLFFNLMFLLVFFAPVAAKMIFWLEVSRLEDRVPVVLSTLDRLSDQLVATSDQVGRDMAAALRRAVAASPILRKDVAPAPFRPWDQLVPLWLAAQLTADPGTVGRLLGASLETALAASAPAQNVRQLLDHVADDLARRPEAEAAAMAHALRQAISALPDRLPHPSSMLISVVLGLDAPWSQIGLAGFLGLVTGILLIIYNVSRALLTFFVTRLRDEEQLTEHTPRRKRWPLWLHKERAGPANWPRLARSLAWARSCQEMFRGFPAALGDSYLWLMRPQKIVAKLQYLAYFMTAIHVYNTAIGTIALPT